MPTAADIPGFLQRLDATMLADRRRLRARLLAEQRRPRAEPRVLERLAEEIDRSSARAEARRKGLPRPSFGATILPVLQRREEIARVIERHQVCVICGETGSGKTTQLPQICLSLGRGVAGMIGHTQPRRIAARTVAARIAEELGTSLGPRGAVGYKVRFGDETGEGTYVKLMTDGILLAETQGDRDLLAYDTIIVDEAHERSLNIDFLLGYLRQLLPRRPELKVIVTSATIDPQKLSAHFGGPERCPVVEVSGRTYPVEVRYRPISEREQDDFEANEDWAVLDAVDELSRRGMPAGDILIFLPGEREIRNTAEALRKHHPPGTEILPLYARLSPGEQMKVFQPHGRRRIVLATNVAETSITVPGIRYVVDTGLARISRYSSRTKVQRLPIEAISQASANQRAGRCGRVSEGVCIRLYGEDDYRSRPPFTDPEIQRSNLAAVILQMKALGLGAVEAFPFVDPPDSRAIKDGYETLFELGAIEEATGTAELTEVGRRLARLPMDPRIGRMILAAAEEHCLREVLVIASALAVQDPRDRPMDRQEEADIAQQRFTHESSDFLTLANIWKAFRAEGERLSHSKLRSWCRDHFLSYTRLREWLETYKQIHEIVAEMGFKENGEPAPYDAVHRALLAGLLSNVASRYDLGGGQAEYHAPRGVKASIFPGSTLFKKKPKWIVAGEIVQTTRLYARMAAKIEPEWIERVGGGLLKRQVGEVHWSAETGQACAWEKATLFGLTIVPRRRVPLGPTDPKQARELFIHHALVEQEVLIDAPFARHNAEVLAEARGFEAKLRRHDVIAEGIERFRFFDARLPPEVWSLAAFAKWRAHAERGNPRLLFMSLKDVLEPDAAEEATPARFPDAAPIADGRDAPRGDLEYVFDPAKPADGVTISLPLEALPRLDADRCDWLVPGMLAEKVHAVLKGLPKAQRVSLGGGEGGLRKVAEDCAGVMSFGRGSLAAALSEALEVLKGVRLTPAELSGKGLPDYLRMNVRVTDHHGKEVAQGRDAAELKQRLEGKVKRALAGLARAQFGREGLTKWDFGELPDRYEADRPGGGTVVAYPAIADHGESVALTLADSPEAAQRMTHAGVRRLFVLAAKDELAFRLGMLGNIDAMYKHFAPLGPPAELKAAMLDLIAERTFMAGQAALRTGEQFEERLNAQWGRIGQITREVGELVARILDTRHRLAMKLASGTPRIWEESTNDLREHAAFLMPPNFLRGCTWARLREFPRYLQGMLMRLEKLRGDGVGRESKLMGELRPLWKRFTGYVAAAHAHRVQQQQALEAEGEASPERGGAGGAGGGGGGGAGGGGGGGGGGKGRTG
ncbi:MAG: ATP-dependent RNA helicase HrpA, partial [Phycisphaerales bacterium]|nr:ATP-dependent RNA helicase HrpA [Phycisphaerales bacterium]